MHFTAIRYGLGHGLVLMPVILSLFGAVERRQPAAAEAGPGRDAKGEAVAASATKNEAGS